MEGLSYDTAQIAMVIADNILGEFEQQGFMEKARQQGVKDDQHLRSKGGTEAVKTEKDVEDQNTHDIIEAVEAVRT